MAIFFSDSFNIYSESYKARVPYLKPEITWCSPDSYLPWKSFPQPNVLDFFNKRVVCSYSRRENKWSLWLHNKRNSLV